MANGTDSTLITNGGMDPLSRFGKYGLQGLVIAVLFYFVWWNMNKMASVMERSTEALVEFKGVIIQMKDATKENADEIRKLREERRADRRIR